VVEVQTLRCLNLAESAPSISGVVSVPDELVPPSARPGDLLYCLDPNLQLLGANEAWRAFACANGGEELLRPEWHRDALASFSGRDKLRWQGIYSALLNGRLSSHEEHFTCPSPVERRNYRLRVTPRHDPGGRITSLLHHLVLEEALHATSGGSLMRTPPSAPNQSSSAAPNRIVRAGSFHVAQCLAPLEDVGGDLLWHFERPYGSTDVVFADVMGHGAAAAHQAARISELLDALAPASESVSGKVSSLNRALLQQRSGASHPHQEFACGLYLRLHPQESCVDVCSFAHEGPIFSNSGRVSVPTGFPLGMLSEIEPWPELRLDFQQLGRRFLLCSDGVTEQFNAEGEMFGAQRLEKCFLEGRELPVSALVPALVARLDAFRGSALIKDDRSLLAVELAK